MLHPPRDLKHDDSRFGDEARLRGYLEDVMEIKDDLPMN